MTTTLVTQRRARSTRATNLAAEGLRLLGEADAWSPGRLRLRLFQGRQHPDLLLIVSDWTSREAAQTYLKTSPIRPPIEALTLGKAAYGFYHELTSYEPLTAPVAIATCTRVTCSRAAMSALLTYMLDVTGPILRAQPGLILHALYQNDDQPSQFLSMRGYASLESYEAVRSGIYARLDAGLRERGAHLTYFVGQAVADIMPPTAGGERAAD
jgi:quinol monooxygenase YgiN